jgi:hypothetical protein
MTRPKLLTFGVVMLVFACLTTGLFWEHHQLQRMRADNARLLANGVELDSLKDEISRLRQAQPGPAELERLRQGQAELLRLRGEASRLRQQLKEAELVKRDLPAKESPRESAPAGEAVSPVETFSASIRATLASG